MMILCTRVLHTECLLSLHTCVTESQRGSQIEEARNHTISGAILCPAQTAAAAGGARKPLHAFKTDQSTAASPLFIMHTYRCVIFICRESANRVGLTNILDFPRFLILADERLAKWANQQDECNIQWRVNPTQVWYPLAHSVLPR